MPSFEEVRRKIARHFPKNAGTPARGKLVWDWETARTIIDSTGKYRITKKVDEELKVEAYSLELCATRVAWQRVRIGTLAAVRLGHCLLLTAEDAPLMCSNHIRQRPA